MQVDERTRTAINRLTSNERECLRRRLLPQTAKEMAVDLGISPHAVEKRLKMARAKLGVSSSLVAARLLAAEEGYQVPVPRPADLFRPAGAGQGQAAALPERLASIGRLPMIVVALCLALVAQDAPAPPASHARVIYETMGDVQFRPASQQEVDVFLADQFTMLDHDRSGFIEREEAPDQNDPERSKAGMHDGSVVGHNGRSRWIGLIDQNDDGKIDQAEYVFWARRFWPAGKVPANWRGVATAAAARLP